MRKPDPRFMTPTLLEASLDELLWDLFVATRGAVRKWAERTNQTAQAKTAYLGQHLASVLTAVPGEGTAARGHDLIDGGEVKACSRADQLGRCRACEAPVPAWRTECPACGSVDVNRKTDSHWIFAIRSEAELNQLQTHPRVVFILSDRTHNQSDIRIRAWEVWPQHPSHAYFNRFLSNYYENNYLVKGARAAPANLHPLKFDFLLMNPVRIFDASLKDVDGPDAEVAIDEHFDPKADRDDAPVEVLPPSLCRPDEILGLLRSAPEKLEPGLAPDASLADLEAAVKKRGGLYRSAVDAALRDVPAAARLLVPMRSKRIKTSESIYKRRDIPSADTL